jgi:hypothetical protein
MFLDAAIEPIASAYVVRRRDMRPQEKIFVNINELSAMQPDQSELGS